MEAKRICISLIFVVISVLTTTTQGRYTLVSDYVQLGKPCDPTQQNSGYVDGPEWYGKVCVSETYCNPQSKLCDCADAKTGTETWKRTFQNKECRLLPGSACMTFVDDKSYRCVDNSKCTETRQGEDMSKCMADGPCDSGDAQCICEPGKKCLTEAVPVTPM